MYDLIVIGGGWAGFPASEYAAKHGLKTALIEKDSLGGTCLNYGCIPTKTLLHSTKLLSEIKKADKFAIDINSSAAIDLSKLINRKNEVIDRLKAGIKYLISINKIDLFTEEAKILNPNEVKAGDVVLKTKYILIATGSKPQELPSIKFDGKKIISSTDALNLENLPRNILIIGGGVIGCEFAEIFASLGTQVKIVEISAGLLPGIDREISKKIETILKKRGIEICLNTDASSLDFNTYDKILLCVGRKPNIDCLENIGLKFKNNCVEVNEYLQTAVSNIYAAGDCIGGLFLAHVASYEGRLATKNILGTNTEKKDYNSIPCGIYTNPEIASIGMSEYEARNNNAEIVVKKLDFLSLGLAHAIGETEGFIKIITNKDDTLLGASIIGPKATEIINILSLAIKNGLKGNDLKKTVFAHPTISEGILETLLH